MSKKGQVNFLLEQSNQRHAQLDYHYSFLFEEKGARESSIWIAVSRRLQFNFGNITNFWYF